MTDASRTLTIRRIPEPTRARFGSDEISGHTRGRLRSALPAEEPDLNLRPHSRLIPGYRIHHNSTAEHAIKLLEEYVKQYGIHHVFTSIRRPSTVGKIEAFQEAYTCEASIYATRKEFVNC